MGVGMVLENCSIHQKLLKTFFVKKLVKVKNCCLTKNIQITFFLYYGSRNGIRKLFYSSKIVKNVFCKKLVKVKNCCFTKNIQITFFYIIGVGMVLENCSIHQKLLKTFFVKNL